MKYNGVVIGCGKIGVAYEADEKRPRPRSHASALHENPRTELAAFVGARPEDRENAKRFFPDVPFYEDVSACLEDIKPDIAIIAASTNAHLSLVRECAAHHAPIIIGEKPIASDIEGALEIARLVRESGSVFALNYQRRYFPLFKKAREKLTEGELGQIHEVSCLYDNGLFNNGGHAIDTVQFLLGSRMVSASATLNAVNTTHPEGDLNVEGEVETNGGTQIVLKSFDQKVTPIHELHIVGEKGSLHITEYGYVFKWTDVSGRVVRQEEDRISMTAGVLHDAIDAYEKKRDPLSGLSNGIETLAVLEALEKSAESGGRRVDIAVYS